MNSSDQIALTEDEEKIKTVIEALTGGQLVEIKNQLRWRPAWFVKVDCGGTILPIYVRGDRKGDLMPFDDILEREAKILQVLANHRIPVPRIYGMCEDPKAIIMEDVPGTRDVNEASSDELRQQVARQYIDAIVAMHNIPLQAFADIGLNIPQNPAEIALAGIHAYRPLYERNKVRPDPFLEFSIKWLTNNVPEHRTEACFLQFDAGQFMFDSSGLTALYDFEFGLIGDPMCDLATMAGRHSVEPMGDDVATLWQHYENISGRKIEPRVAYYQQANFLTSANMQFVGCVQQPKAGDPHDVYTEWNMGMRHNLILALGACMDVQFEEPAAMTMDENPTVEFQMLADLVDSIQAESDAQVSSKNAVNRMVQYMAAKDTYHQALKKAYVDDAVALMGCKPETENDIDQQLEDFIFSAGPEKDEAILHFFYRASRRQIAAVGHTQLGGYAANVRIEPW